MKNVRVIVDLQFGSTGKGLIAGYLAEKYPCDTVVAAWRPNAGHTYIDLLDRKFIHTMLPNGIVSPKLERIMIGPEAVINAEALQRETEEAEKLLGVELFSKIIIHANAAVVQEQHRTDERKLVAIGSTMKGSAEAVIDKMRRDPKGIATAGQNPGALGPRLAGRVFTADFYDFKLDTAHNIQVEGAQGFSLGMNQRFYPYSTSRECTATQILSDCAIPRSFGKVSVIGTLRTFPIRVANRFDADGKQVGTSGPGYPDQEEITFHSIGQPVELTTVTKLPRRIFTFSDNQLFDAVRASAPDFLFLNFLNYLPVGERADFLARVNEVSEAAGGGPVRWTGTGPAYDGVTEQERFNVRL